MLFFDAQPFFESVFIKRIDNAGALRQDNLIGSFIDFYESDLGDLFDQNDDIHSVTFHQ
jgi:hypothetical protein